MRQSPALRIAHLLEERNAILSYHDPMIPHVDEEGFDLRSVDLSKENLERQELVLIVTDHSSVDYAFVVQHARLVLDTRNAQAHRGRQRDKIGCMLTVLVVDVTWTRRGSGAAPSDQWTTLARKPFEESPRLPGV